ARRQRRQPLADGGDLFPADAHIRFHGPAGGDDGAARDDGVESHLPTLLNRSPEALERRLPGDPAPHASVAKGCGVPPSSERREGLWGAPFQGAVAKRRGCVRPSTTLSPDPLPTWCPAARTLRPFGAPPLEGRVL